ncbi:hypothetical protein [uncultured Kordia sp.]|uniref:hypothetical protein n=1 Tax=uncultured Kordia sp. TaxID=507699 RepID=UPI002634D412|nr:hypothetical protein [uncultured Kordia sp.]
MKNILWSLPVLFLCVITSCNGQKVVSATTQQTCEAKDGYWYNNKCWEGFKDEGISKKDIDSVVIAQMKLLKDATITINDKKHAIDFFFPEQEDENVLLVTSFKDMKETILVIASQEDIMGEKKGSFEAQGIYMKGDIMNSDIEPEMVAQGIVVGTIDEDFNVEIDGELQGVNGQYAITIKGNEAVMGAGNSKIEVKGNEAYLSGTLGTITYHQIKNIIENHKNVQTIVLTQVDGSINDAVNMHTGRILREAGLNTKVLSDSDIASGGVDLFCAGNKRIIEKGAKLGVHSWAGEDIKADELPKDHPAHQYQIAYFTQMLGAKNGPEFYFYTLSAAPPENIHYMSEKEIKDWKLQNN